jgi:hypothetical protein
MPEYHCHDMVLLQKISSKLQRLGCEPLAGELCCAFCMYSHAGWLG